MSSTYGTMSYFTQSSKFFKWAELIALIIFIAYTQNRVYGLPISRKTGMRDNVNSLLSTFTNNNDNNNNNHNNNSDNDTDGRHISSRSAPNKQNNAISSPFRNDRILKRNSLLAESRKFERIQKLRRVRRSWPPETDLRASLSKLREQSFQELSIPDDSFANLYTTETLPEDITSLQPDQWIYFRICTQANEQKDYHPEGLQDFIRQRIKLHSCLNTNIERPEFGKNQALILTIQNVPAIRFDILSRKLHTLQTLVKEDFVKIWLHRAENTILVGIRPQLVHDRFEFEFLLETFEKEKNDVKNSLPSAVVSHRRARFQRDVTNLEHPSESLSLNNDGTTHSISATCLKQFTIHFMSNMMKLILKSSPTGPYLIYDPIPVDEVEKNEGKSKILSNWTEPIHDTQTNTVADDQKTLKAKTGGTELQTPAPFISTDLLLDAANPDPVTITEAMDEQAIRIAQSYVSLNREPHNDHGVGMVSRTSQSLLIPTEPNGRTVVQVVHLNEVVQFTCQGHVTDGQLRVLYDQDIWHEQSHPELTFHSIDGFEQLMRINLRATRITWSNVTKDALKWGLRDMDALTNVKCGRHRSSRLVEHNLFPGTPEQSVEQLFFVTVSPKHFQLIQKYVLGKLTNLYEPIGTAKLDGKGDEIPTFPPDRSTTEGIPGASAKLGSEKFVGFWNLSLSSLSSAKLVLSIIVVILIVSSIILVIRNYGRVRPYLSNTPVVSQWVGFGGGDTPSQRHQKHLYPRGQYNRRVRRDQSPRTTASMTNSNAIDSLDDSCQLKITRCNPLLGGESNEIMPRWQCARQRKSNSESFDRRV